MVFLDLVQLILEGFVEVGFSMLLEERTLEALNEEGVFCLQWEGLPSTLLFCAPSWPTWPLPSLGLKEVLSVHHCTHHLESSPRGIGEPSVSTEA